MDWYSETEYARSVNGASDPLGPDSGSTRVLKGGSWLTRASSCRSAARGAEPPDFECSTVGVRVARSVGDAPVPTSPRTDSSKPGDKEEALELRREPSLGTNARLRGEIEMAVLSLHVTDKSANVDLLLALPDSHLCGASAGDGGEGVDEPPPTEVMLTRPINVGRSDVMQAPVASGDGLKPAISSGWNEARVERRSWQAAGSHLLSHVDSKHQPAWSLTAVPTIPN
jgi:hypothetical protein